MGARFSRLVSVAAAGGVITGSLLLGAGAAFAAPAAPGDVVPARCGQTVQANPGDSVRVTPTLGLPFLVPISGANGPLQSITKPLTGLLCEVQVQVVEPVTSRVAAAVPQAKPVTDAVAAGTGAALSPKAAPSSAAAAPAAATTPAATAPVAPMVPAPMAPALPPAALAAAAPAFAPSFNALPSSFLGATAPLSAPAGLPAYDPGQLLGSAFPGLKAGAPAYLGYDPASAVTTASQVQALPVDGMSGGMGVPVMIAVLALAGVAAFVVRSMVLRRAAGSAAAAPAEVEAPADDDISMEALANVQGEAPESPALGFPAAHHEADETELMGTTGR